MDKFSVVKKYIDKLDCEGLLALGAPRDEYDRESQRICQMIDKNSPVSEISKAIISIFADSMGEVPYNNASNDIEAISERIAEELKTSTIA